MIFQVIDLRDATTAGMAVEAGSPEEAARQVLGMPVYRSGHRRDLVAKVYWTTSVSKNMVRLYIKPIER